jgi:hypothetical protein
MKLLETCSYFGKWDCPVCGIQRELKEFYRAEPEDDLKLTLECGHEIYLSEAQQ